MDSPAPDVPYVNWIHRTRDVVVAPEQVEQRVAREIAGKDSQVTHRTIRYHDVRGGVVLQDKEVGSQWDTSYIRSMNTSHLLQVVHISPLIEVLEGLNSTSSSAVWENGPNNAQSSYKFQSKQRHVYLSRAVSAALTMSAIFNRLHIFWWSWLHRRQWR